MKKIFKEFGVHFCAATILLGMSLLIEDHHGADEGLHSLIIMICGALISIGGYQYLKNRKGIVILIVGVVILGIVLSTFSF
ncbi:hypothetical protein D3C78_1531410 [compost metagenome]